MNIPSPKTLGVLLFPQFETLDVFGPVELFGLIPELVNIAFISENGGLIKSAQGQFIHSECNLGDSPKLDILLVPGGMGTRKEVFNQHLLQWLKTKAVRTELILSVCTGAALLAKAGLLDGLNATTNKLAFEWVQSQSDKVNWIKKARWVDAGHIITSSGISAGMDMSLYVIGRLFGTNISHEVARKAEYIINESADADPFAL